MPLTMLRQHASLRRNSALWAVMGMGRAGAVPGSVCCQRWTMGHVRLTMLSEMDHGPCEAHHAVRDGPWAMRGSPCCQRCTMGHARLTMLSEMDHGPC